VIQRYLATHTATERNHNKLNNEFEPRTHESTNMALTFPRYSAKLSPTNWIKSRFVSDKKDGSHFWHWIFIVSCLQAALTWPLKNVPVPCLQNTSWSFYDIGHTELKGTNGLLNSPGDAIVINDGVPVTFVMLTVKIKWPSIYHEPFSRVRANWSASTYCYHTSLLFQCFICTSPITLPTTLLWKFLCPERQCVCKCEETVVLNYLLTYLLNCLLTYLQTYLLNYLLT
jgi:hypothetical protein